MLNALRYIFFAVSLSIAVIACGSAGSDGESGGGGTIPPNTDPITVSTDQTVYQPGEPVTFSLNRSADAGTVVRYKYLGKVIDEASVSGDGWQWTPPSDDYRGYMAELYRQDSGSEKLLATIGIDVSSDWSRFPRYGFLTDYSRMEPSQMDEVLDNLNRHHINGLQFYDWQYKHHQMLAGTVNDPDSVWTNIANQDVYFSTVSGYIQKAHKRNMKAMFYNLIYGALEDAAADGVSGQWYLFTDQNHSNRDMHSLPSPMFKSSIYLLDPSNTGWQQYLAGENQKVYDALGFDGFHMDQLGDRGARYDYDGNPVQLNQTYGPFIDVMRQAAPGKYHVFNAVNQYGQSGIAKASSDFLYTEVWSPNDGYSDLARIIQDNNSFSEGTKNSVLAAYMNYDEADQEGYFNTPGVLLTDAVIFAFGGSHLELGEHMLGSEYFPNDNLDMKKDLREALVSYYDFLVAYENLLRDGGAFNEPGVTTLGQVTLNAWPPQQGKVSVVGKQVDGRQVIHLLNFSDATTMKWRDNNGSQAYPFEQKDIPLSFESDQAVARIWVATPDKRDGASQDLDFSRNGSKISFTLPSLKYWSMIVVEFE